MKEPSLLHQVLHPPKKIRRIRLVLGIIAFLIFFPIFNAMWSNNADRAYIDESVICAQNYIKQNFEAPGPGQVSWRVDSQPLGDDQFEVDNYIECRDEAGNLATANYKCSVTVIDYKALQCDTTCEAY